MRPFGKIHPGWGITAVRLAMAVILISAGYQKWFRFGVFSGVAAAFSKYGLPAPALFALLAATIELVGGLAILLGVWVRWIGVLVALEFFVATFFVQMRLQGLSGGRLELLLLAGGILLALAGAGKLALSDDMAEGAATS